MSRVVVVGGGLGGLTASALLAHAGHRVTLLEASPELGGKSRRILLGEDRIDTGPSLVTFPAVWDELLRRLGDGERAPERTRDAGALDLVRMPEVGRYYYDGEETSLPVASPSCCSPIRSTGPPSRRCAGCWTCTARASPRAPTSTA
jgi:phytoene desaturase